MTEAIYPILGNVARNLPTLPRVSSSRTRDLVIEGLRVYVTTDDRPTEGSETISFEREGEGKELVKDKPPVTKVLQQTEG